MCVCCACYCHDCSWLPLWAGLGGSCFCNFKSLFTSSSSTLRLFDSSTHRLFKLFMFVCPFSFGRPSGWVCGMGIFCKSFISVSGLHIDSSTLRLFEHFKLFRNFCKSFYKFFRSTHHCFSLFFQLINSSVVTCMLFSSSITLLASSPDDEEFLGRLRSSLLSFVCVLQVLVKSSLLHRAGSSPQQLSLTQSWPEEELNRSCWEWTYICSGSSSQMR